jgi:hypothetical protein
MANKLSAAQAAIKDMQACKMDITMFIGSVKATIILNEECGINNDRISKEVPKKSNPTPKVAKGYHYQVPDLHLRVKLTVRVFNPDGTLKVSDDDWDF